MRKPVILLTALLVIVLITVGVGCGGEEVTPTPADGATPTPTVKPITLKFVSSTMVNGAAAQAYYLFADLVEEYTDGRVKVDVYPGSQLFPVTEEWEAVVTGAVDIFGDATYWIYQYVPDVMIFYIDGIWEGYDHAYAALEDSELPQILAERIEEAGPVKVLGFLPASIVMGIINSVRETTHLKDLEGLRIQSSPGSPPPALYDYVGMAGVPLSFEETSTAFIQGVLDAVHITADVIANLRLYEKGKHVLYRTSMFPTLTMIMNRDSWESLPADIQDIILNRVMPEVYEFDKMNYRESEDAAMALTAQNVETVHWVTQEDLDAYVEYSQTHPTIQTQMLMVDPRIVEIIEDIRPSKQ